MREWERKKRGKALEAKSLALSNAVGRRERKKEKGSLLSKDGGGSLTVDVLWAILEAGWLSSSSSSVS